MPDECTDLDALTPGGQGDEERGMSGNEESRGQSEADGNSTEPYRMTPEIQSAIDAPLAWCESHPRSDYPNLNDEQYADLILDEATCLGLYGP